MSSAPEAEESSWPWKMAILSIPRFFMYSARAGMPIPALGQARNTYSQPCFIQVELKPVPMQGILASSKNCPEASTQLLIKEPQTTSTLSTSISLVAIFTASSGDAWSS